MRDGGEIMLLASGETRVLGCPGAVLVFVWANNRIMLTYIILVTSPIMLTYFLNRAIGKRRTSFVLGCPVRTSKYRPPLLSRLETGRSASAPRAPGLYRTQEYRGQGRGGHFHKIKP